MKSIVKTNEELRTDRERKRNHDRRLEKERYVSERQENCRARIFQRRSELIDMARKYRKLNAELNDDRSRQLSEFYVNESCRVEDELRQLMADDNVSGSNNYRIS